MLKKLIHSLWFLVLVNIVNLAVFGYLIVVNRSVEFLVYIIAIVVIFFAILKTYKKYKYSMSVLWGLSLLAFLHLAGGSIYIGDTRLYDIIILPIIGAPYYILKYDQVVHTFGMYITTIVLWHIFKKHYNAKGKRPFSNTAILMILLSVTGIGVGALNESVEFFAALISANNGVGGYENTSLDLLANLTGSALASLHIYYLHKKRR